MERIVALVEGRTEYHFLLLTANALVLRKLPNSDDCPLDVIAEVAIDALEAIGGTITKVLVIIDREGRDQSAAQMASALAGLIQPAIGRRTLIVGVTDRHVENWILADQENVAAVTGAPYAYCGDGTKGKTRFIESWGTDLPPRAKAEILAGISVTRARSRSPSLEAMASQVNFEWPWIDG